MEKFMIAFVGMMAANWFTSYLNEKALRQLPDELKSKLVNLFSGNRLLMPGIMVLSITLFFIAEKNQWISASALLWIYCSFLFVFLGLVSAFSYRKLHNNGFPQSYIHTYLAGAAIRITGLGVCLAVILSDSLKHA